MVAQSQYVYAALISNTVVSEKGQEDREKLLLLYSRVSKT